jgi:AcrR family transcriptional regulator
MVLTRVTRGKIRAQGSILARVEGSRSQVPRGRPGGHELRREVIVHHQRERMLTAAVELIAERGYRAVSVADIVKRAAIARAKFYANFGSKEDCFLIAYDRAAEEALRLVGAACAGSGGDSAGSFAERLRAGLAALLAYLAANPALARACLVEIPAVGPAGEERHERTLAAFAELVRAGRERAGEAEPVAGEVEPILDGLYRLLYRAILDGKPKRLEGLLPDLTEFALISFLGPEALGGAAARPPAA